MAIAILGWPIDQLPVRIAREVVDGGRRVCEKAGIPLAGGHSIDGPEPIFGLAVTGQVPTDAIRKNSSARPGDLIYLTKPLGVGLVTTAQKQGKAEAEDLKMARESMLRLNRIGQDLAVLEGVHAVTDVTGFGLAGHLLEVLEASHCSAEIDYAAIPRMPFVDRYLAMGTTPGGTNRNWNSYGHEVVLQEHHDHRLLADPQTSGGLLITVAPEHQAALEKRLQLGEWNARPIGRIVEKQVSLLYIL
jgi:selenide,water dikinase